MHGGETTPPKGWEGGIKTRAQAQGSLSQNGIGVLVIVVTSFVPNMVTNKENLVVDPTAAFLKLRS